MSPGRNESKKGKSITKPFDKRRFETVRCVCFAVLDHVQGDFHSASRPDWIQGNDIEMGQKEVMSPDVDNGSRGDIDQKDLTSALL